MRSVLSLIAVSLTASVLFTACNGSKDTPVELNSPPNAEAGSDFSQPADQAASLDGGGSYDPDSDPLTYHWSFDSLPEGSELGDREAPFTANNSAIAQTSSFQPDVVGTYVVALKVSDGQVYSDTDYVVVQATDPESVPIADAGIDKEIALGSDAQVSGLGSSDPMGGSLDYIWTLVSVPYSSGLTSADLLIADQMEATFSPDVIGEYSLTLEVSNSMASSVPDSVVITVVGENQAPTADAGSDIVGMDCTLLDVDCTGSFDPEGTALSYFWELQQKPANSAATNTSFVDRTNGATTFLADIAGVYEVSCSVYDGTSWSTPDAITLDLSERDYNTAPTVNAGTDIQQDAGEASCVVDGYGYDCDDCETADVELGTDAVISDADNDPYTLVWVFDENNSDDDEYAMDDENALSTRVLISKTSPEEPGACTETNYTFSLQATDCPGEVATDDVLIAVSCCGASEDSVP